MVLNIKDREVKLRYSMRALMLYENIQNKSFAPSSTTDVLVYMFCVILSSDKELNLTFDEFLDIVDENPKIMVDFSTWLTSEINKEDTLGPKEEEEEEKKKVK